MDKTATATPAKVQLLPLYWTVHSSSIANSHRHSSVLGTQFETVTLSEYADTSTVDLKPGGYRYRSSIEPTEDRPRLGTGERYEDLGLLGMGNGRVAVSATEIWVA